LPGALCGRRANPSATVGTSWFAEDNDSVRSYVKLTLERAGFRVTLARSGDEATGGDQG
jgi:DNA-binding NtrC family response regulator